MINSFINNNKMVNKTTLMVNKTTLMAIALVMTNVSAADNSNELASRITMSGVIEIEAGFTDSIEWGDDQSTSDVVLATAQFGIEFAVAQNVSINMVTLYKEGDVDFDMHEGYLQIDNLLGDQLSLSMGKMYLPFGQLETNLVNDTLALEMVSPDQSIGFRETAMKLNWVSGNFSFDGYVFNGDIDADDELSDWGLSLGYSYETVSFGVDYLNNVADSAMISGALEEGQQITPLSNLSAISVNAMLELGNTTLLFEHVQTDDLNEIGFNSSHSPSVSQLDLGYDLGNGWSVAIAYQLTDQAIELAMPESRLTAGFSTSFFNEALSLSAEYWHDGDYAMDEGGTGEKSNGIVIQLASEF